MENLFFICCSEKHKANLFALPKRSTFMSEANTGTIKLSTKQTKAGFLFIMQEFL
jgi:hypothetical protein